MPRRDTASRNRCRPRISTRGDATADARDATAAGDAGLEARAFRDGPCSVERDRVRAAVAARSDVQRWYLESDRGGRHAGDGDVVHSIANSESADRRGGGAVDK